MSLCVGTGSQLLIQYLISIEEAKGILKIGFQGFIKCQQILYEQNSVIGTLLCKLSIYESACLLPSVPSPVSRITVDGVLTLDCD